MTNDLVRHDVNWFDDRRAQRRSARAGGRRKTVATPQDERRRLITLGLTMRFAGLIAQPNQRCSCRLKTEDYDFAPKAASLREIIWPPPLIFRMRFLKREVSASRCGAGNAGIVNDIAVCASSGGSHLQEIARLASLRFIFAGSRRR